MVDVGIPSSAAFSGSLSRDQLIVHYAKLGYSAPEIWKLLKNVHGIALRSASFQTLKLLLQESDIMLISNYIEFIHFWLHYNWKAFDIYKD